MTQSFDPEAFRFQYKEFEPVNGETLRLYWSMACEYLNPSDGGMLSGTKLGLALNLMTAHIAKLMSVVEAGKSGGVVASATEGGVSVTLQPPPVKSAWQHWLAQTPYGTQVWALLSVASAGGLYIGGSDERSAFRKAGGVW